MKKEDLQKMKVAELKAICKERNIPHYHGKNCFNKSELVEAIVKAGNENTQAKSDSEAKTNTVSSKGGVVIDMEKKIKYIEAATVGMFVAFRLPNGKVKSAKIIRKSTSKKKFMLEEKYGKQHIVEYNDIVWVRKGTTWPRGVYMMLKGLA